MKKVFSIILFFFALSASAQPYFSFGTATNPRGEKFLVDAHGFEIGGKKVLPVMGEIHYARVPAYDWKREILKMKAGGVTIVSTYVFWIHHEFEEGVWDWSGNRNLRKFVETCRECDMPLVLRIGPFCHGEVYQGGVPSWILKRLSDKNAKPRSLTKVWIDATEKLYQNIFSQVKGLLWKDGGPIVGIQLENECRGPWQYYQTLKDMAVKIGFDTPFYTRTGWPKLSGNEKFGEMLPLYGDYADGFWDKSMADMPGDYPKAFLMKASQVSATIATETFSKGELTDENENIPMKSAISYPYLTCELGGGMMTSYHRRINIFDQDALALAVCKVGSGSNLPGYYMYHGGTNPYNSQQSMAEMQDTPYGFTSHNDMPYMSYDFQSPLGEVGQVNESFHRTRMFHQFLSDWGDELSQFDATIINDTLAKRGDYQFVNTYVRMLNPSGHSYVVDGKIMAQPFCKIGNKTYYVEIPGVTPKGLSNVISFDKAHRAYKIDGKLRYAKHDGGVLFKDGSKVKEEWWERKKPISSVLLKPASTLRQVKKGVDKVAEMPNDSDFAKAAVFTFDSKDIEVKKAETEDLFLRIAYHGDVCRVYADGKLVEDNFWNGKPFYVRATDLVGKKVEIRILPLTKSGMIYLQPDQKSELDSADKYLLSLDKIDVFQRMTK